MAIKAPNYLDLVERPWVERAVAAAAATVFFAGVTAAITLGAPEIAPTLAAPASAGHPRTGTGASTGDFTGWTPAAAYRDIAAARRPGATVRSRASSAGASTASTASAAESAASTIGGVNDPAGAPPAATDPPTSPITDQNVSGQDVSGQDVYVGGSLGDTSLAIDASPSGVGATTGDTSVGTPTSEPPSDGVTISADPGQGLPPIVLGIP